MHGDLGVLLTWQGWVGIAIFFAVVVGPADLLDTQLPKRYEWSRRPWMSMRFWVGIMLLFWTIVIMTWVGITGGFDG